MRSFSLAVLVALVALAADPYSYGRVGGEGLNQPHIAWQPVATLVLAALLIATLLFAWRREVKAAIVLSMAELLGFLAMNVALFARDGLDRAVMGFEHSALAGFALITGVAARVVAQVVLRRLRVVTAAATAHISTA